MEEDKQKKQEEKKEEKKIVEPIKPKEEIKKETEVKKEDKEKKKPLTKKEKAKPKKTFAVVNALNLPLSTKQSGAICKFIKNKRINDAISDLQQVIMHKKAVPMKGEIAHKKAVKGIASGSGKYPKKATEHFIRLLRTLAANANVNGLEEPIIKEAVADIGSRPYGRFGSIRRKRSHIKIVARERKQKEKK